jgi:anti-sigma factor RsiW
MKCAAIWDRLPALAGGDLDREQTRRCEEHLAACVSCRARYAELQQTLRILQRVGQSEPLPRGFSAALQERLAAEPAPAPSRLSRLWRWLAELHLDSAPRLALIAVSLAVLGAAPLLLRGRSPSVSASLGGSGLPVYPRPSAAAEHEVAAAFRVPAQRTAVLRFDFVADVEVPDVEFEVVLPSELFFIDGSQPVPDKRLVWRGSLASGSNPIPLAVRGSQPGHYRITAHARGGGVDVQHDILLEVVRS